MRIPKIYKLGVRYPKIVLSLALLLSFVSAYFISKLEIVTDFDSLLPEGTSSVKNLRVFEEAFGGFSYLVITVEGEGALSKNFAREMGAEIQKFPEVNYVSAEKPIDYFKKRQWLFLDLPDLREMERRILRSLELEKHGVSATFHKFMDFADEEDKPDLSFEDIRKKYELKWSGASASQSEENSTPFEVVWVKLKKVSGGLSFNRAFMERIKAVEAKLKVDPQFQDLKVGYTGSYQTSLEESGLIQKEIAWVSGVVTLALLLILILYFKRLSAAFLIGFPLTLSIFWSMALVYLFLGHLNMITGFAAAILAGLGSDYGIFLLTRFYQEEEKHSDFNTAMDLAFGNTGRATFGSMVTTVGAFSALLFSKFGVFVEFGVVGALGLLMNYLGMMLLMPAVLVLARNFEKFSWFRTLQSWDKHPHWFSRLVNLDFIPKLFVPKRVLLPLVFVGILSLLSLWILPEQSKIYFESGQLDTSSLPGNRLYGKVSEQNFGTLQPGVLLTQTYEEQERVIRELDALLEKQGPSNLIYNKVVGVSTFIPAEQEQRLSLIRGLSEKFKQVRLVNPDLKKKTLASIDDTLAAGQINLENVPVDIRRVFVASTAKPLYGVFLYPSLPRDGSENIEKYQAGISKLKKEFKLNFTEVDSAFVQQDLVNLIRSEAPRGMLLILVFFGLFLAFTLKPFSRAVLVFANLLVSLILLAGILKVFGIRLNVMNIAMIPVVLGTGIDCFIHFSHRFDEEKNLPSIILSETSPIFISSLTSIIGFGGLVLTSSSGLRSVGWVAAMGLAIVTLMCVIVFPRCLMIFSRRNEKTLSLSQPIADLD